jgi:3-hydroxyisobutyrate dehydrogenase
MKIGFVGLGIMGHPMAMHLASAGHEVMGYDLDGAKGADWLRAVSNSGRQAYLGTSLPEVGRFAELVITMLPDGGVVQSAVLGASGGGLIDGMVSGCLVLDTSSCEPWLTLQTAEHLAQKGIGMVDAAVSGAQWGAEAADLVFMVGGTPDDLQRVEPILKIMGPRIFHLGALSSGHAMKCINNTITAAILAASTEGLQMGIRSGLDPAAMVDVLNASTGGSWISQTHFHKRILSRRFDDPFKLELMIKDMGIAMALKERAGDGLPSPLLDLAHERWQQAGRSASQGASISEFVRWMEHESTTEIRSLNV